MIRFFIICLLITLVWADRTVKVTVDRQKINEGDSVTLTITATNIKDDLEVKIPKMQGLKVVNGPNKSSSTNKSSSKKTFSSESYFWVGIRYSR